MAISSGPTSAIRRVRILKNSLKSSASIISRLKIAETHTSAQRSKSITGYYFIVLYEAELAGPNDRLELRELNIFLGKNYLVTVHSRPIRAIATAARLWHEWTDRAEQGSGLLAYLSDRRNR